MLNRSSATALNLLRRAAGNVIPALCRPRPAALAAVVVFCAFIAAEASMSQASPKVVYDFFGEQGSLGGQFERPIGVAANTTGNGPADQGDIYVVDSLNNRIQRFDKSGEFISAWGANVFTPSVDEVQQLTVTATAGTYTLSFEGQVTTAIAYNATATIVQTRLRALSTTITTNATANRNIVVTGSDGGPYNIAFEEALSATDVPEVLADTTLLTGAATPSTLVGGTGQYEICIVADDCRAAAGTGGANVGDTAKNGSLDQPVSIAADQDTGNLYVADRENRRISEYRGDGTFIRSFGFDVDATTEPVAFEICPASNRCKFGRGGSGVGQFGTANPLFEAPGYGIALSPPDGNPSSGNVYLANTGNRKVTVYDLDGSSPVVFGTNTDFSGSQPRAIAVDSRGIVYANSVESGAGIIRRYDSLDAIGGGVGFLPPIQSPPLTSGQAESVTAGLAVDPDDDGPGDDTDVLDVLRVPSTPGNQAPSVIQQFGPVNDPGLSVAPASVDAEHGAEADLRNVNGLGLDENSGGRLYISESVTAHRVWILSDPPPVPPIVTTGGVGAGFNPTLRTLNGIVNPNEYKVAGCRFEYGPTSEYGASANCVQSPDSLGKGTVDAPVSASTEPLEPETLYHYRLVAANAGQTSFGEDRTFTSGGPPPDPCANATIRAAQGIHSMLLPDCMALEMVNPPAKGGVNIGNPQISVNGERVRFEARAPISGEASVSDPIGGGMYVAKRDASAQRWVSLATEPLDPELSQSWTGGAGSAKGFDPDFSSWFNVVATEPQRNAATARAFRGGLEGSLNPFSPLLVPLNMAAGQPGDYYRSSLPLTRFRGASADQSRLYFSPGPLSGATRTNVRYLPGDPAPAGSQAMPNTYVTGLVGGEEPQLELLARDGDGRLWGGSCGTQIGGSQLLVQDSRLEESVSETTHSQGAISNDGSRVYFSARPGQPEAGNCEPAANKIRILRRIETVEGPVISPLVSSECTRVAPTPCKTEAQLNGSDNYQGASVDGSKVYFTSSRQLVDSDLDGQLDAAGTGSTTSGGIAVSGVVTTTGTFIAGQSLSGSGIPVGTTIVGGFGDTIFLSAAATATATNVALTANTECSNSVAVMGCDLYLYDKSRPFGNRLTQVSAGETVDGHSAGQDAKVLDLITGVSGDGSHAYFVAEGVLTGPNGEGRSPSSAANARNLYVYKRDAVHPDGYLAFVGTLDSEKDVEQGFQGGLWGGYPGFSNSAYPVPALGKDGAGNEIGGDGHNLVFISNAPLTNDDEDGDFADLFSYDAESEELRRLSKAAEGGSDNGAFNVRHRASGYLAGGTPAGPAWAEMGRWASESGGEVVFTTAEGLIPGDTDGGSNSYLWRNGHLVRLPGTGVQSEGQIVLSPDGDTVAFATKSRLLSEDRDFTKSIYVARVGGGFAAPSVPVTCAPDGENECQGMLEDPSEVARLGSTAVGAGNVPRNASSCNRKQVRRGSRCISKRKLAHRICRKVKHKQKRRCVRKQIRRLSRATHTHWRAAK